MLGLIEWFSFPTNGQEALAEANRKIVDAEMEQLLLDRLATVSETIYPHQRGRVFFEGTYWFARCPFSLTILPDTPVVVRDRHKLTLFVEPLSFSI